MAGRRRGDGPDPFRGAGAWRRAGAARAGGQGLCQWRCQSPQYDGLGDVRHRCRAGACVLDPVLPRDLAGGAGSRRHPPRSVQPGPRPLAGVFRECSDRRHPVPPDRRYRGAAGAGRVGDFAGCAQCADRVWVVRDADRDQPAPRGHRRGRRSRGRWADAAVRPAGKAAVEGLARPHRRPRCLCRGNHQRAARRSGVHVRKPGQDALRCDGGAQFRDRDTADPDPDHVDTDRDPVRLRCHHLRVVGRWARRRGGADDGRGAFRFCAVRGAAGVIGCVPQ